MIKIQFNNQIMQIPKTTTLHDFLSQQGLSKEQGFAIAINQSFVPRANYATSFLQEGDEINVIKPMQGG